MTITYGAWREGRPTELLARIRSMWPARSRPCSLRACPAHLERGDAAKAVASVRDRYRNDVIIWGSLTLTEALFRAKLVDRLRLRSVPRLIGAGVSVAPRDLGLTQLTLVDSKVYPKGHLVLDYRVEH